jgi:3-deoxy-D-manno-octulosonic-acid transferase
MLSLYSLGIRVYVGLIRIASLFNSQAKKWISGRENVFQLLEGFHKFPGKAVWVHCASLGEFEQARPVIERIKQDRNVKLLLTFFSPSGFEIRKNYPHADLVAYLPADTAANASRFVELIRPELVIFVKYEFWFNYLNEIGRRKIPLFLISGIFRDDHFLFRYPGTSYLNYLQAFTYFYLQDENSLKNLNKRGFMNASVSGDTRYDRVLEIASTAKEIATVKDFADDRVVLVAGSTWEPDEDLLVKLVNDEGIKKLQLKLIIAPHHVGPAVIDRLMQKFPGARKFSEGSFSNASVLIIDNIGMLSSLYRYGTIAYVGGGFGKAVHNVLEPAAYSMPVIFGPANKKFYEIGLMKKEKIGFEISSSEELVSTIRSLVEDQSKLSMLKAKISEFMKTNAGAVNKIMSDLKKYL